MTDRTQPVLSAEDIGHLSTAITDSILHRLTGYSDVAALTHGQLHDLVLASVLGALSAYGEEDV